MGYETCIRQKEAWELETLIVSEEESDVWPEGCAISFQWMKTTKRRQLFLVSSKALTAIHVKVVEAVRNYLKVYITVIVD